MRLHYLAGLCTVYFCITGASFAAPADHLVLSKVVYDAANPEEPAGSAEFIEIYNPTDQPVSLDNYILTDLNGNNTANPHKYYNYPELLGSNTVGTFADYMVQFPPGYILQPKKTAVVTQSARMFLLKYFSGLEHKTAEADVINQLPSMDIAAALQRFNSIPTSQLLFEVSDSTNPYFLGGDLPEVPNMINRTLNTSAAPAEPRDARNWLLNMSNAGEFTALVYYAGGNTPIKDVDVVVWGAPTAEQDVFPLKTNVTVFAGTPDEFTYKPDNGNGAAGGNLVAAPQTSVGIYRVSFVEPGETSTDGNGLTGHDETTEITAQSWRWIPSHQHLSYVDATPPINPPGHVNEVEIVQAERALKNPAPNQPLTLNAKVRNPAAITMARFVVTVGSGSPQDYSMVYAAPTAPESDASVSIGSYPEGTIIRWYAEITGPNNSASRVPASGERLFQVTANPILPGEIVINEMMYDPFGTDNGNSTSSGSEWIELYNATSRNIDLSYSRWSYKDTGTNLNLYEFPEGTIIPPNDYIVLVARKPVFVDHYSSLAIPDSKIIPFTPSPITSGLLASGDVINIVFVNDYSWPSETPIFIDRVPFDSGPDSAANPPVMSDWPGKRPSSSGQPGTGNYDGTNPNNGGPSIELIHPTLDNSLGSNWKASVNPHIQNPVAPLNPRGGTPTAQNSVYVGTSAVGDWVIY